MDLEDGPQLDGQVSVVHEACRQLREQRLEGVPELAQHLALADVLELLLLLHAPRRTHEVLEQHRNAHLQGDPARDDDEAAHVCAGGPIHLAVLKDEDEGLGPGVPGGDAEHGDEGSHEDAEVVRRDVGEEGHAQDGI